ncbi:heavy metal-associated isoprenylated plant protein 7 [Fagus crenata]
MGEEEKKPEEKKMEEKKTEEKKEEEKKAEEKPAEEKKGEEGKEAKEEAPPPPPPPPPEIVLKVYMHCEGCARKVRRSLKGFEGVEDIITDCRTSKVVVKGEKADPLKVLERVQRKNHRQVELISPIPKPKAEEEKKPEAEKPKPEEKKEEPQIISVVLKVHMHCEACAQEIKKRILRMKGVESAEPDLKSSEVTVKGVFDPTKLVEYVYKRTGKHAVIVKQEPEKKEKEESKDVKKEEKKVEESGGGDGKGSKAEEENKEKKAEEAKPPEATVVVATEETNKVVEVQTNAYYHYPQHALEMYAYPPQMFSDENPNACSIM